MIVVADAGPIIHLSRIGHLDLIPFLYGRVVVPRQVYDEVVRTEGTPPGSEELRHAEWVEVEEREIRSKVSRLLEGHLDAGEAAALGLALDLKADLILSDDRQARSAAERLGFRVRGTLGILLEAKRQSRVPALAPLLHALRAEGVWLSKELVGLILKEAGESEGSGVLMGTEHPSGD